MNNHDALDPFFDFTETVASIFERGRPLHGNVDGPLDAAAIVTKSGKSKSPAPPVTRAQALFQGQNNPKKKRKIVRLEQWIEVRIVEGSAVTKLYPSNEKLIEQGSAMLPPPEFVYRRLNFPDGIPPPYDWCGAPRDTPREHGGCGIQRMTIDTWLDLIDREKHRADGHIGPTGLGNLPRPSEHGLCSCKTCTANQALQSVYEPKTAR